MAYAWKYVPICIRFISETDTHSLSGINLILVDSHGKVVQEFNVSINHIPINEILNDKYQIYITEESLIDDINVNWYIGKYKSHISIVDESAVELKKFLWFFHQNGFKFLPNDLISGNSLEDVTLLEVELNLHSKTNNYRSINFTQSTKLDEIEIESYPFNFTNPILFKKFTAYGHVNYVVGKNLAYLTDVKYLENMVGGVVKKCSSQDSIGLVLGNLKKLNGDGDLLVILPWTIIWSIILKQPINRLLKSHVSVNKLNATQIAATKVPSSILPILLTNGISSTWGSCIYYNKDTIITNHHVIKPILDDDSTGNYIFLSEQDLITISQDKDTIIIPYKYLDLAFIKLSDANQFILQESRFSPINLNSHPYNIGDEVSTIGYGLFFNNRHVKPIESKGRILNKFELPYFVSSVEKSPVVVITSSSCWNGSSGGALVNKHNELLGIICSNATINLPDFGEGEAFEKLLRFSLILPVEMINESYRTMHVKEKLHLNYKIDKIWNLDSYHRDVIIERESKI